MMAAQNAAQAPPQFFGAHQLPTRENRVANASARSLGSFATPITSPEGDAAGIGTDDLFSAAAVATAASRMSQSSRNSQELRRTSSTGSLTRPLSRRNSSTSMGGGGGGVRVPVLKPLDFAPVPFAESNEAQAAMSARSRRSSVASIGAARAAASGASSLPHPPLEPSFSFFRHAHGQMQGDNMPDLRSVRDDVNGLPVENAAPPLRLGLGLGLDGSMAAPLSTLTSGSVTSFHEQQDLQAQAGAPMSRPTSTSLSSPPLSGPPSVPSAPPVGTAPWSAPPPVTTVTSGPPLAAGLAAGVSAMPAFGNPALRAKAKGKPAPAYAAYVPAAMPAATFAPPSQAPVAEEASVQLSALAVDRDTVLQSKEAPADEVDLPPHSYDSADMPPVLPAVPPGSISQGEGGAGREQEQGGRGVTVMKTVPISVQPFVPRRPSDASTSSTGRRTPPAIFNAEGAGGVRRSSVGLLPAEQATPAGQQATAPTSALFKDAGGNGEAFFSRPAPQPQYQRVKAATSGTAAPAHALFGLSAPSAPPVPALPPTVPRVTATTQEVSAPAQLFKAKDSAADGVAAQLAAMGLSVKPVPVQRPRLGSQGAGLGHVPVGAPTTASLFANVPDSGPGSEYFSSSGLASFTTAVGGISSSASDADAFFGGAAVSGGGAGGGHHGGLHGGDLTQQQQEDSSAFEQGHEGSAYGDDMTVAQPPTSGYDGSPYASEFDAQLQHVHGGQEGQGQEQHGHAESPYETAPQQPWSMPASSVPWQSVPPSASMHPPWQSGGGTPSTRAPSPASSSSGAYPLSAGVGPAKGRGATVTAIPAFGSTQSGGSSKPVGFDPSSWSASSSSKSSTPAVSAPLASEHAKPHSGPLPASALLASAQAGPPAAPFAPSESSSTAALPWAASTSVADVPVPHVGKKRTGPPRPQFAVFQPGFAASAADLPHLLPSMPIGAPAPFTGTQPVQDAPVAAADSVSQPTLRGSRERTEWERRLAQAVAAQGGPLVTAGQASAGLDMLHARLGAILEADMEEWRSKAHGDEVSAVQEHEQMVRADVELLHGVLVALVEYAGTGSTASSASAVQAACSLLLAQSGHMTHGLEPGPSTLPPTPDTTGSYAARVEQVQAQMLLGNKEAALQTAIEGQHWGHAFLLAGHMSKEAHGRVVEAFRLATCPTHTSLPFSYLIKAMAGDTAGVRADLGLSLFPGSSAGLLHPSSGSQWRAVLSALWANGILSDRQSLGDIAGKLEANMPTCHAAHAVRLLAGASLLALPSSPPTAASSSHALHVDLHLVGGQLTKGSSGTELGTISFAALLRSELLEYACKSSSKAGKLPLAQPLKLYTAQALWDSGQQQAAGQYLAAVRTGIEDVLGADYTLQEKSVKYGPDGTACIGPFSLSFLLEVEDTEERFGQAEGQRRRTSPQVRDTLVKMLAGPPAKPKATASSLSSMFGSSSTPSTSQLPTSKPADYVPVAAPAASTRTVRASSLFASASVDSSMPAADVPSTPGRGQSVERVEQAQAQQGTPALQASTGGGGGGGLFSGIRSMFRGRRGNAGSEADTPAGPRVVKLDEPGGQGAKPYFDDKLGRWVFPGETEEDSASPPPPPVMAAAPAAGGSDSTTPAVPQFSATARAGGKANRINRYVAQVPTTGAGTRTGTTAAGAGSAGDAAAPPAPQPAASAAKVKFAVFAPPPPPAPVSTTTADEASAALDAQEGRQPEPPMPIAQPFQPVPGPQRSAAASASTWQPSAPPAPPMELSDLSSAVPDAPSSSPAPAFGAQSAEDAMAFFGSAWDEPAAAAGGSVPLPTAPAAPVPSNASGQPAPWAQGNTGGIGVGTSSVGQAGGAPVPPSAAPVAAQPWAAPGSFSAGLGAAASARLAPTASKDDWF